MASFRVPIRKYTVQLEWGTLRIIVVFDRVVFADIIF